MADTRRREEWSRVSAVMALVANAHRGPKCTHVFEPREFDPFAEGKRQTAMPPKVGIEVLKAVFVEGIVPKEVCG